MLAKSIAIATAAIVAVTAFTTQRAEARGLGMGVGIGLGLIAASQMARASREQRPAYAPRRFESTRTRHHSASKTVQRSNDDAEEAAERRAKAKAKRAAEARAEIARTQAKLEKTRTVSSASKEAEASKTVTMADPSPLAALTRADAGGSDVAVTAARTATAAAVEDGRQPVAAGGGERTAEATASPSIDCKRFVPAAGMTVSVPCGN